MQWSYVTARELNCKDPSNHLDSPFTKFKPTNKNITSHKHAFYFTLNIIIVYQIIGNCITNIFKVITNKVQSSTTNSEHREFVEQQFYTIISDYTPYKQFWKYWMTYDMLMQIKCQLVSVNLAKQHHVICIYSVQRTPNFFISSFHRY